MLVTHPPHEATPTHYKSLDIKIHKLEAWVVDAIRQQAAASPQKTMAGYISELLRNEVMRRKQVVFDMITDHQDKIRAKYGQPQGNAAVEILRSMRDDEDDA